MTIWYYALIAGIAIIWLYFAGRAITLGVLQSFKLFFMQEGKQIQKQEKHDGKKTQKKYEE